jgi:hypothetical protein
MAMNLFTVATRSESPLDASLATPSRSSVSNFLTLQSFTNFAAMAGAISAAWHALRQLDAALGTLWVPYGMAVLWGVISFAMSWEGLRKERQPGAILAGGFIALVNSLVLAGAVVGTDAAFAGP